MAQTPRCDLCPEEDAEVMWTSMTDGSTVAIGKACLPAFVVGIAQTLGLVALPADLVPDTMGGTLTLDAPDEASEPPTEPTPKPTRKRREAPASEPVDA